MDKQKVALVLSMGGARGIAHIGVIEELLRDNFYCRKLDGSDGRRNVCFGKAGGM